MIATRPGPVPPGVVRRFTRSREKPRGVVWFGARSFWGHLRHLVASAIASESVDSRDWMEVDEPQALIQRIVEVLGGDAHAGSLVQALGRDLYIDFVADTGDDVAVSRAVARLLFASYELPDPDHPDAFLVAPRGDVLFFGGDTAYPVATAKEITNRLIVPWTQVLQALPDDGRTRVLLGLPGQPRLVRWSGWIRAHVSRDERRRTTASPRWRPSHSPCWSTTRSGRANSSSAAPWRSRGPSY